MGKPVIATNVPSCKDMVKKWNEWFWSKSNPEKNWHMPSWKWRRWALKKGWRWALQEEKCSWALFIWSYNQGIWLCALRPDGQPTHYSKEKTTAWPLRVNQYFGFDCDLVIDVRSPEEYNHAHLPGSKIYPLFRRWKGCGRTFTSSTAKRMRSK